MPGRPGPSRRRRRLPAQDFPIHFGARDAAGLLRGETADLIIDALVGYGLKSAQEGAVAELIRWANQSGAPVLSLDVPSGLNATTGETPGEFTRARWTMTLALPKTGLNFQNAGELWLSDLGIPEGVYQRLGLRYAAPFGKSFRVRLPPR